MQKCKHENCNNDVEWIDEPEDYCPKCIGLMVDDYQEFLDKKIRAGLVT